MNTKERNYDIVNGPNKDALFDSCKYAYTGRSRIVLDFEVAIGYTLPPSESGAAYIPMKIKDLIITGIEHEDGSGESFNLEGNANVDLEIRRFAGDVEYHWHRFKAYYNTKRRCGRITFDYY